MIQRHDKGLDCFNQEVTRRRSLDLLDRRIRLFRSHSRTKAKITELESWELCWYIGALTVSSGSGDGTGWGNSMILTVGRSNNQYHRVLTATSRPSEGGLYADFEENPIPDDTTVCGTACGRHFLYTALTNAVLWSPKANQMF